jgi:hypothetical protein
VIPVLDEEAAVGATVARVLAACAGAAAGPAGAGPGGAPGEAGGRGPDPPPGAERDGAADREPGDVEVIVVDDGSRDRSPQIVGAIAGVRLIRHPATRGYGAALKTGIASARGDLIAFLDADGTYPPEALPALVRAARNGADLVVGSRMSGAPSEMPPARRLGNRLFAWLLSGLGTQPVRDGTSGMRVVRRQALPRLYPLPDGLHFTPIMSLRAMHEGLRLVEVPIPYGDRAGRSKLSVVRDGLRYLRAILWTALGYAPGRLLGLAGVAGMALAGVVGLALGGLRLGGVTRLGPGGVAAVYLALVAGAAGASLLGFATTFGYLVRLGGGPAPRPLVAIRALRWGGPLLGAAGLGVAAGALALGWRGWPVERLWLYLAGSALLLLMGLQLGLCAALVGVLRDAAERDARARADLGEPGAGAGPGGT